MAGGGVTAVAPARAWRYVTADTLARFDGTEAGLPVLITFRGLIYDVTERFMWMRGRHFPA